MKFNIFNKDWWSRNNVKEPEHRTSIKSQIDEDDAIEENLPLSDDELAIVDRFERLPAGCKRNISRIQKSGPTNWEEFSTLITKHEIGGHTHK